MAVKNKVSTQDEKKPSPYHRIQTQLANQIADIAPGEKLPSEPSLAKALGVSRATLREAMRTFEAQGLIRRRQGVGTFVVGPARVIETGLNVLESIEALSQKMGLDVRMGDLTIENDQANLDIAEKLAIAPGTAIVTISRVIQTDDRPVAYLIDTLPELFISQGELKSDFNGSVLDHLIAKENFDISNSNTYIHAVAAPAKIARALEIQRGDVLLMFEAYLFEESGRVLDYSYSYFLPGYFRFHIIRSVDTSLKNNRKG